MANTFVQQFVAASMSSVYHCMVWYVEQFNSVGAYKRQLT
jgi:hypothetical protein